MRNLFFILLVLTISLSAQTYTTNFAYQMGRSGEYLGASFGVKLKSWNNDKVTLKGIAGFYRGNHWDSKAYIKNFNRFEAGVESRNYFILGSTFFSSMDFCYIYNTFESFTGTSFNNETKNGFMFAIGGGVKVFTPGAFTLKYVFGMQHGLRAGIEFEF